MSSARYAAALLLATACIIRNLAFRWSELPLRCVNVRHFARRTGFPRLCAIWKKTSCSQQRPRHTWRHACAQPQSSVPPQRLQPPPSPPFLPWRRVAHRQSPTTCVRHCVVLEHVLDAWACDTLRATRAAREMVQGFLPYVGFQQVAQHGLRLCRARSLRRLSLRLCSRKQLQRYPRGIIPSRHAA